MTVKIKKVHHFMCSGLIFFLPSAVGLLLRQFYRSKSVSQISSGRDANITPTEISSLSLQTLLNLNELMLALSQKGQAMVLKNGTLLLTHVTLSHLDKNRLKFILSVLHLAKRALEKDIRQLPGQILGRVLYPFDEVTSFFVEQALQWVNANNNTNRVLLPLGFGAHSGLKLAGGSEVYSFPLKSDANAMVVLSTSMLIAVGCEDNTVVAHALNRSLGGLMEEKFSISHHVDQITCLVATPLLLFVGSADCTISAWNDSKQLISVLRGHTNRITALSFVEAHQILLSASHDKTIRVWKHFSCVSVLSMEAQGDWITSVVASDSHSLCICGTDVGTLNVWNWTLKQRLFTLEEAHESDVSALVLHQSGVFSASWDETIKRWNLNEQTGELTLLQGFEGHTDWVTCLAVAENTLFSGSRDCTIRVWDLQGEQKQQHYVLSGHDSTVTALAVKGDDLFSASSHMRVFEWRNPICFPLSSELLMHQMESLCAVATRAGDVCFTGGKDGQILIWQVEQSGACGVLDGHSGWVNCLLLLPAEEKLLCSGSGDKTVRIWEWESGECLHILHGHLHWVVQLVVSQHHAHEIESIDFEGQHLVWDTMTGTLVTRVEKKDIPFEINILEEKPEEVVEVGFTLDDDDDPADQLPELMKPRRRVCRPKGLGFILWGVKE